MKLVSFNIIFFLISFGITACGWLPKDHKEQDTVNPLDALRAKRDKILALSRTNLDPQTGWPLDVSCDGLTLTAPYVLGGGSSDWFKADVNGELYRDALHQCGPANGTSSTTGSQDGYITGALVFWRAKNAGQVQDVLTYLGNNSDYAGDPHSGVSYVTSPVVNTYEIMLALLQGQTPPKPVDNPDPNGASLTLLTGFRAHLLVWHILDRGVIYGALNDVEFQLLKDQVARQPRNAFYQAVLNKFSKGDQTSAIETLMNEDMFPSTQLATNSNKCVAYLWSTDDTPSDWSPCPNSTPSKFTQIDFLIAAAIILGEV